jgi:deazaflavin-dependent oxidoreductase (nitroreductase family)
MTRLTKDPRASGAEHHGAHPRQVPPLVRLFNRLARILAGRRLYALLRHSGRRSGKRFETPVVAWRTRSGRLVPIAWGTEADWYRNTVAAGGCDIRLRGRWYHCATPRVVAQAEALVQLAEPIRTVVRLGPVRHFLLLSEVREIGEASLA